MSSKVLNTSVSLDDLSASELNAAIDDTNFPGTKCPLTESLGGASTAAGGGVVVANTTTSVVAGKSVKPSNGVGGGQSVLKEEEEDDKVENKDNTNPKKLTLTIKANGENGSNNINNNINNTTGHVTPWTPRTSTTPG